MDKRIVGIYTDASCISKNPSDIGITWAWCGVDSQGNRVVQDCGSIPYKKGKFIFSNNLAEFIAAVKALEAMEEGWNGYLYSDSECTLGRLFHNWSVEKLPKNVVSRAYAALDRLGEVKPILVQGHPNKRELVNGVGKSGNKTSVHNCYVDGLCSAEAKKVLEVLNQVDNRL